MIKCYNKHNIIKDRSLSTMFFCEDCCFHIMPQMCKNEIMVELHSKFEAKIITKILSDAITVDNIEDHCCCNPKSIDTTNWLLIEEGEKNVAVFSGPFSAPLYNVNTYECKGCGYHICEQILNKPQCDIIRDILMKKMFNHISQCLKKRIYSY